MPDKYGFNHLGGDVYCIESDCTVGGPIYEWKTDRRQVHFLTHNFRVVREGSPEFEGDTRLDTCRVCSRQFTQEKKRGRPRVLCYICKPPGGEL